MSEKLKCTSLETPRLILNGFSENDFNELVGIALDLNKEAVHGKCKPFVAFYNGLDGVCDEKKTQENVRIYLDRVLGKTDTNDDKWMHCYAVREKPDMRLIGLVGFVFFRDSRDKSIIHHDLGYFMSPRFQRRGYMLDAARALCRHFFEQFDLLEATTHPDNKASASLLEKLGAVIEGMEQKSKYNGEPRLKFVLKKDDFFML